MSETNNSEQETLPLVDIISNGTETANNDQDHQNIRISQEDGPDIQQGKDRWFGWEQFGKLCSTFGSKKGSVVPNIQPNDNPEDTNQSFHWSMLLSASSGMFLLVCGIALILSSHLAKGHIFTEAPVVNEWFFSVMFFTGIIFFIYWIIDDHFLSGRPSSQLPPHKEYGSFWMKNGAIGFGFVSMIYCVVELIDKLKLGHQEVEENNGHHKIDNLKPGNQTVEDEENNGHHKLEIIEIVRPLLQLLFIIMQMMFVVIDKKINIYRNPRLAMFVFMLLIATNLCNWMNVVTLETIHDIHTAQNDPESNCKIKTTDHHAKEDHSKDLSYKWGPYLLPFSIEYSLICFGMLYSMWKSAKQEYCKYKNAINDNRDRRQSEPSSSHNGKITFLSLGFFAGLIPMLIAIVSMILFYVLKKDDKMGVTLYTQILLSLISLVAVVIGICKLKKLSYHVTSREYEFDAFLLNMSQFGVLMYCAFSLIASLKLLIFSSDHVKVASVADHVKVASVAIIASTITLFQTIAQSIFILDGFHRKSETDNHLRNKPGMQTVIFLLVCNFAMWIVDSFITIKANNHPIQAAFFESCSVWPIMLHMCLPLQIFYRFHSTVSLYEILTESYIGVH